MIEPATNTRRADAPITVNENDGSNPALKPAEPTSNLFALAKSISGWTSNLVVSAIVVVIALTFGSQLVSSWVPGKSQSKSTGFDIRQSWPTLQACSLQFGDLPFQLTREIVEGSESEVSLFLQSRCQEELENHIQPVGKIGQQESRLIRNSVDREPVGQAEGKWRIFLGPKLDRSQPLPIAIGIRDNCQSSSVTATNAGKFESRLVVWAMAMPAEDNRWTTFVAQASTLDSTLGLDQFLPWNARRTISMVDPAGGSMIGFLGGEFESAIAYYKTMAEERNWKLEIERATDPNSWSARILPTKESKISGLQVQLTLDHNENLTGILLAQGNHPPASHNESPK